MSSAPALAFPLQGTRVRIDAPGDDGTSPIVRLADGIAVGAMALERDGVRLTVRAFRVDAAHRSYGCGSEAGWLTVQAAESAGFEVLRVWAPPDRGLAVYFWFRMGFRPLHGEGPEGGLWMERRAAQSAILGP